MTIQQTHRADLPPGGGDTTVTLRDDTLTHDLAVLRGRVARSAVRTGTEVRVDLTGLTRVSSVTVAALLWARRTCGARGVAFAVHGATGGQWVVLQRCGLLGTDAGGRR
ncbi:MAG TPA: STAS domain-containing protein [Pedococcus sp.]|jgi:anti-anti-sigma regulatory factor